MASSQVFIGSQSIRSQSIGSQSIGSQNIGRLTGKDVKAGKNIRKDDQGFEVFDDYFSDTGSECSAFDGSVWDTSRDVSKRATPQVGQAIAVMTPFSSNSSKNLSLRNSGSHPRTHGAASSLVCKALSNSRAAFQKEMTSKSVTSDDRLDASVSSGEHLDATLTEEVALESESDFGTPEASAEEASNTPRQHNKSHETSHVNKSRNQANDAQSPISSEPAKRSYSVRRSARKGQQSEDRSEAQSSDLGHLVADVEENALLDSAQKPKESSKVVSEADTPVNQNSKPKAAKGTFILEKPQVNAASVSRSPLVVKKSLRGTHTIEKRKPLKTLANTQTIEKGSKKIDVGGTYTKDKPAKKSNLTHSLEPKQPSKSRVDFGSETDDVASSDDQTLGEVDDVSNDDNSQQNSNVLRNEHPLPDERLTDVETIQMQKDDESVSASTVDNAKLTRSNLSRKKLASKTLDASSDAPSNDNDSFKQPNDIKKRSSKKKSANNTNNSNANDSNKSVATNSLSNVSPSMASLNQLGNELGSITRTENHTKTSYMEATNSAIASFRTRKHLRFSEEAAPVKPRNLSGNVGDGNPVVKVDKQINDSKAQKKSSSGKKSRMSLNEERENQETSETDPPQTVSSLFLTNVESTLDELQVDKKKSGVHNKSNRKSSTSEIYPQHTESSLPVELMLDELQSDKKKSGIHNKSCRKCSTSKVDPQQSVTSLPLDNTETMLDELQVDKKKTGIHNKSRRKSCTSEVDHQEPVTSLPLDNTETMLDELQVDKRKSSSNRNTSTLETCPQQTVSSLPLENVQLTLKELLADEDKSGIHNKSRRRSSTSETAINEDVVVEPTKKSSKDSGASNKVVDHLKRAKPVLKMLPKRGSKSSSDSVQELTGTEAVNDVQVKRSKWKSVNVLELDSEAENSRDVLPETSKVADKSEKSEVAIDKDKKGVFRTASRRSRKVSDVTESQNEPVSRKTSEIDPIYREASDNELQIDKADHVQVDHATATRTGRAVKRKKNSDASIIDDEQNQHHKAKRRSSSLTKTVPIEELKGTDVDNCDGNEPPEVITDADKPENTLSNSRKTSDRDNMGKSEGRASMFSVPFDVEGIFSEDDDDDLIVLEAPIVDRRKVSRKSLDSKVAISDKVQTEVKKKKEDKKVIKSQTTEQPKKNTKGEKSDDFEVLEMKKLKKNRRGSGNSVLKDQSDKQEKSHVSAAIETTKTKKSRKKSNTSRTSKSEKNTKVSSFQETAPADSLSENEHSGNPVSESVTNNKTLEPITVEKEVQIKPVKSAQTKTKNKKGKVSAEAYALDDSGATEMSVHESPTATPVLAPHASVLNGSVKIDEEVSFRNSLASGLSKDEGNDVSDSNDLELAVKKIEPKKRQVTAKGTKNKSKKSAKVVSSAKRKMSQKGTTGKEGKVKKVLAISAPDEKSEEVDDQTSAARENAPLEADDPIMIDGPSDVNQAGKAKRKSRKSMVTFSPSIKNNIAEVQHLTACPQVQSGFINRARRRTFPGQDKETSILAKRQKSVVSLIMNDSEADIDDDDEPEEMAVPEAEVTADLSGAENDAELPAADAPHQSILKKSNTPHSNKRRSVMFTCPVLTPLSISGGETPKAARNSSLRRSQLFESTPIESDRRQDSSTPNTSSIASESIKHYFEVTNSKTPDVPHFPRTRVIAPSKDDNGLRRSKRTRLKPLAHYRNERPDYRRQSDGFVIAGIISPALDMTRIEKDRHRKIIQRRRNHKKTKIPGTPRRLSTHEVLSESVAITDIGEIPIFDVVEEQEVMRECIFDGESLNYINGQGQPATDHDDYIITRPMRHTTFSSGYLLIRPLKEKPMHKLTVDNLIFSVIRGKVAITINRSTAVLESGDKFLVPCGNFYSIRNLRKDTAKLDFTSTRAQS